MALSGHTREVLQETTTGTISYTTTGIFRVKSRIDPYSRGWKFLCSSQISSHVSRMESGINTETFNPAIVHSLQENLAVSNGEQSFLRVNRLYKSTVGKNLGLTCKFQTPMYPVAGPFSC